MFKNIVITINKEGSVYIERTDDREQYIELDDQGFVIKQNWTDTADKLMRLMRAVNALTAPKEDLENN